MKRLLWAALVVVLFLTLLWLLVFAAGYVSVAYANEEEACESPC